MSRGGSYSQGKRQRELDRAAKKRDKAARRDRKREMGPGAVPIATAEEITGALPTIEESLRRMENRQTENRSGSRVPSKLFVGRISPGATVQALEAEFAKFGPVVEAVIVKDRATGESRGFGFVTMESRKDAVKAIEALDGFELDGRAIAVNVATER